MVGKVLHITCIVLLAVLAIMLCINAVRALMADYQAIEFTISHITTKHLNNRTDEHTLTFRAEVDNRLITPENTIVTRQQYHYGDTVKLWYNPETNMVVQDYMAHIITNFISAGLAIVTIAFIWPRRKKVANAKS